MVITSAICPICNKTCDSERGLKIHMSRKHKGNSVCSETEHTPPTIPEQCYSVPLGTSLKLSGEIFCQDPETKIFSLTPSDGLIGKVVHKEFQIQTGKTFLFLSVDRINDRLWSVPEEEVLSNRFEIVSWGDTPKLPEASPIAPTAISSSSIYDPTERNEYLKNVEEYAKVRDKKLEVEKEYCETNKKLRPKILEYLSKYGVETDDGRGDSKMIDGGWAVHYTNSPPTVYVDRNEERIIQWLLDRGATGCLKYTIDVEAWEDLKKTGTVDPDFIKEVEIPREKPSVRKFLVERDAEK